MHNVNNILVIISKTNLFKKKFNFSKLTFMLLILALTCTPSFSGIIKLLVPKDGVAAVSALMKDFTLQGPKAGHDSNKDGIIKFVLDNQADITDVFICKDSLPGKSWYIHLKKENNNNNFDVLEPFYLPDFKVVNNVQGLFFDVNIDQFLAEGLTFTTNQIFSVTNGKIGLTSSLTFMEAGTINGLNDIMDANFVDNLSLYTGDIYVNGFDSFEPIPEPGTFALLLGGLIGFVSFRRKSKSNFKS